MFVNIYLNVSRHYSYIKITHHWMWIFMVYIFEVIKIDILLGISLFLHIDIYMVYVYLKCMNYSFIIGCKINLKVQCHLNSQLEIDRKIFYFYMINYQFLILMSNLLEIYLVTICINLSSKSKLSPRKNKHKIDFSILKSLF